MPRGDDTSPHPALEPIEPTAFRPPTTLTGWRWPRLPWRRLLMLGTLSFALAAIVFIFGARSVELAITPTTATTTVARGFAPHISERYMLLPGRWSVQAEAPGYRPLNATIHITHRPLQQITLTMRPLPGHLRLALSPVASAEVWVDAQRAGQAPGVIKDLEAGSHQLLVRAPRYLDFETEIEIAGKGQEQAIDITLSPAWAEFTLASKPAGADVFSGDERLGITPLHAELMQGERDLRVQKKGFKPWRRRVSVVAGQAINIPDVRLVKDDGYFNVTSTPAGAAVTVDGKFKGETPLKFPVAADDEHALAVLKTGYLPHKARAAVGAGETHNLDVPLIPELAIIELVTTPPDAELLINGIAHGSATQRLELPTYEHEIIIRKAGFATYRTLVTPRKGIAKKLQIRLKTAAEMAALTPPVAPPSAAAVPPAQSAGSPSAPSLAEQQAQLITNTLVPEELRGAPVQFAADGLVHSILGQELKLVKGGEFVASNGAKVRLTRPYYLGLREVSNSEYRKFISAHLSQGVTGQDLNADNLPVVNITWEAAATYCNWLSRRESLPPYYQIKFGRVLGVNPDAVGYRLPTEAEWDFVARIDLDGQTLEFPWRGGFPPRGRAGNFADQASGGLAESPIKGYDDGFAASAPVGSFPPNLRGYHDLAGNVSEWMHDFFAPTGIPAGTNPLGPDNGNTHSVRGSSWRHGEPAELRLAYRASAQLPRPDLGFRLARYAQ